MTNHIHLLLTAHRPDAISRLMQSLGRRYAQYVNRVYRRSGSVWEGRFKASLIQAEEYLLTCYRYIELNPARADMVRDPGEYRWSSYRWHGLGASNGLITDHPLYMALGLDDAVRRAAYRGLFRVHLDEEALDGAGGGGNRQADRIAATRQARSRIVERHAGADGLGFIEGGCDVRRKEIDSGTFGFLACK